MNSSIENLGIIAGSRGLPLLVAREARKSGVRRIAAVAFEGETNPELASLVDNIVWLRVGQLSKMISAFRAAGITNCVMAGQIAPKKLFDLRPDLKAMMLLFKLKEKNAHTIFSAIGDELARNGIQLVEATPWLTTAMPSSGFHIGPRLSKQEREDAEFGFKMAKELARLDIGQTVVVKEGTVLAVEAFEGTDRCLMRGGELAGKGAGAVAVKVTKPNHDMRFDIPCVGLGTMEVCRSAGVSVLAVEAMKTIVLDREQVERLIKKSGPALFTVG